MSSARQFILPFSHPPQFAEADFVASPGNLDARAWLDRPESWPQSRLILSGPEGSGKTHLLHIWAARHGAEIRSGAGVRGLPASPQTALAIDDADETPDEAALFHLINLAAEAGVMLLLTSRASPAQWAVRLPDLASRLRASAHVAIGAPDDELLRNLLLRLASDRQLVIPPAVADFLLLHLPRTQAALREAVARLDRAAMAQGGRPSRAIAAGIIADMTGSEKTELEKTGARGPLLMSKHDNTMIFDPATPLPLYQAMKPVRSYP
jgi:chromosomal replication initiation ATPase DnaA